MLDRIGQLSRWLLAASIGCLVLLETARAAIGQVVRPPDLGVWLSQQRGPDGRVSFVITDLLADGVFAREGLREGDQIMLINGRMIGHEQQFVQAFYGSEAVQLAIASNGHIQYLTFSSAAVMNGMVALDPYYQAGFFLDEQRRDAIVVQRVFPATPAFYAGMRSGDVIVRLYDRPVPSAADVTAGLTKALRQNEALKFTVNRNGETRQLWLSAPEPLNRFRSRPSALSPTAIAPAPLPQPVTPSAPLLAPPQFPNPTPAIPSPPPAIPVLPPPGAVTGGT